MTAVATFAGAQVHEHRLRNGLQVLIVERHLDPVVAVMLWYRVGSRDESPAEAGMSHFLEHMMFKGTPRFGKGEVDLRTTVLGGSNNAYTSMDHTAYWFELASDRWETALELEADRMRGLALDPREFEAEKAVVLEELSMGEDDPWRRLSRQVGELVFGAHPYGRPIIGTVDALGRMTPEQMGAFHRRHYHPRNATLVIAGDVKPRAAMAAVREHFGGLDLPAPAGGSYFPAICEPQGERRVSLHWDDPSSRLVMGWLAAEVGSPEDFALDLISTLLTSGRLSRLYRRLVLEEGLATSVSTSNDARVKAGVFWLYAEAVQGVAPEKLEAAIGAEFERLADERVSTAELKRARKLLAAGEAHEGETVSDLAEHIGEYATDAEWRMALELGSHRERVSAKQIQEVARKLLGRERRVVGWSLPKEGA
jgi:zinc protease